MSTPSHQEFWNARYASGQTPWDFNGIPADLQAFLKRRVRGSTPAGPGRGRVLIPGCGVGYEIKAFAAERLAGYKVPKALIWVDQVRRSPAGKQDYRWAKELVASAS